MQAPPRGTEFGALPRETRYGDGTFPRWHERFTLYPRNSWQPISLNRHVERIRSQLDGMCTRNGAASGMEIERSIRGRPGPQLSAEYLYLLHNRWGAGSSLDGALSDLISPGCISMADVAGRQVRGRDEFPVDHEILAAVHRLLEAVDLNVYFDAVATALQQYKPCLIGVTWPGGGGHAVVATELARDEQANRLGGSRWVIRGPNSWGEEWGEPPGYTREELAWLKANGREPLTGGFYTLTEAQCRDFKTYGCWAFGSST
jgi:hypothetical protein